MASRNIFVIGASAGGVDALCRLVGALPVDLAASVFIVLHVPSHSPSFLGDILRRCGRLKAVTARHGEKIHSKRIYVAPPDKHLLIRSHHIQLANSPKINYMRPAIDPLFQSAAISYGARVVGVLLSGVLSDGSRGLATIKQNKGITVVQDPDEARHPEMPKNALENVAIDYCLPIKQIAAFLVQLVNEPMNVKMPKRAKSKMEAQLTEYGLNPITDRVLNKLGVSSAFTCPECHGTLWELNDKRTLRYRCRIGHAYDIENLLARQSDSVEDVLWAAVRALEENATLASRVAERMQKSHPQSTKLFRQKAKAAAENAKKLRNILLQNKPKLSS